MNPDARSQTAAYIREPTLGAAILLSVLVTVLPGIAHARAPAQATRAHASQVEALSTAKRYGRNVKVAEGVLERILQNAPILDVSRVSCQHLKTYVFRCRFDIGSYDGDEVWIGQARLRAHSFHTDSLLYHYTVRGRIRTCTYAPVKRCRIRKINRRGNTRTAFQAPGVE